MIHGVIKNGQIVVDPRHQLPEGAVVQVVVVPEDKTGVPAEGTEKDLLEFAGLLTDLPPDYASQHDHDIHGTPKR